MGGGGEGRGRKRKWVRGNCSTCVPNVDTIYAQKYFKEINHECEMDASNIVFTCGVVLFLYLHTVISGLKKLGML